MAKTFGPVKVVDGIDLEIQSGEFVVLVGPSGCGKSTTLRMVAGLEQVSGGTITIGDKVVNHLAPKDRGVAMVFQNYALYPHLTVRDNISFGLRLGKMSRAEIEAEVQRAAAILELGPLLDRQPAELSGGQRQRVAMGRAIVRNPSVFLFDEPLSNLDAKLRTQMRAEIKRLHARLGTTVIYVTHDQLEAMTLADRIVVMRKGVIEQMGTPRQLFNSPATAFVAGFMGSPPMNLLPCTLGSEAGQSVRALRPEAQAGRCPPAARRRRWPAAPSCCSACGPRTCACRRARARSRSRARSNWWSRWAPNRWCMCASASELVIVRAEGRRWSRPTSRSSCTSTCSASTCSTAPPTAASSTTRRPPHERQRTPVDEAPQETLLQALRRDWMLYAMLAPALIWFAAVHVPADVGPADRLQAVQHLQGHRRAAPGSASSTSPRCSRTASSTARIWNTLVISFYSLILASPVPILLALMINEVQSKGLRKTVQTVGLPAALHLGRDRGRHRRSRCCRPPPGWSTTRWRRWAWTASTS